MRSGFVLILLSAASLCLASGCNNSRSCEQDSDCFSGEQCLDQICVPQNGGGGADADGNGDDSGTGGEDATVADDQLAQIEAGDEISCAMYGDGRVFCWGQNTGGLLHVDSQIEELDYPTRVNDLPPARELHLGWMYACILSQDSEVWCWGENWGAKSGLDDSEIIPPTKVEVGKVSELRPGFRGGCALTEDRKTTICWGRAPDSKTFDKQVLDFDVGEEHACAVVEGGDVRCWGSDRFSRIGVDDPIRGISDAVSISAGWRHTCAIKSDGSVWCWGHNDERQLGHPLDDPDGSELPIQVPDVSDAVEVYAETIHTCALLEGGTIKCWGGFAGFETGNYRDSEYKAPTIVFPFSSGVVDFDSGNIHNCALKSSGTAYCWGSNRQHQLGNADADYREEDPVEVVF